MNEVLALICEFLPDSTLTYVNQAYAEYFNSTPESLIGRRFLELLPEEARESTRATYMTATPEKPTVHLEHLAVRNGGLVWLSWWDKAIFDEAGHLLRFTSIGVDITEQKQATRRLAETIERYDYMQQVTRTFAWEVNLDGLFTFVAPAVEQLLGYRPEELVRRLHFYDLAPKEDRAAKRALLKNALASQRKLNLREHRLVAKDGRTLWVTTTGVPIIADDGSLQGFSGFDLDITHKKESEAEITASRIRESAILSAIPDMVFTFQPDGTLLGYRANDERDLFVTPAQFLGRKLEEVLPQDAARAIMAATQRAIASGTLEVAHYSITRDGATQNYEARLTLISNGQLLAIVRNVTREKLKDEQLVESERRMRAMLNALPGVVFLFDRESRYIYVHAKHPSILYAPAEQLLGHSLIQVLGKELGERLTAANNRAWKSRAIESVEYDLLIEGQTRTFEAYVSVMDEERLLWVVHEVTQRKEVERQRTKIFTQLNQALKIAKLGSFEYNAADKKLSWSEELYRIFGLRHEEFDGSPEAFMRRIHPDDRERLLRIHTLPEDGLDAQVELEHRIIRANDGATRILHASLIQQSDASGQVTRLLGVVQDITEKVEARAERERLLAAIEQAGEGIMLTTPDGTITYVNAAFEKNTGYSRAEAIGRKPNFLKSGALETAFYKNLWDTISNGEVWTGRFLNRRKDGSLYTEESSISPILGDDGQIEAFVEVSSDITLQVARDAQLIESQRLESVGRLAGGVAHDYNNMLQIILACAESALTQVAPESPVHKELTEITVAATKSAAITRQLLTSARQQTAEPRLLNINGSVHGMLNMLGRLIGPDIRLDWQPGAEVWPVFIPQTRVDQVLANLCINARDAMPEGVGTITLSTRNVVLSEAEAKKANQPPGEYVRLSVQDTGSGIPETILTKIFEPFFSTKELGKGTGLGLPTVYGIVKQASGFIHISSELGRGTTVDIDLPRAAATNAAAAASPAPDERKGNGETILVVDDEPGVLSIMLKMLEQQGYQAFGTSAPREAVEMAQTRPFALLVTDVMMPGISGTELARQIREQQPAIKCLFISGYSETNARHTEKEDATTAFLQKPFSLASLSEKVGRLLHTPSTQ